jgi:hypothetical protein
MNIILCIQILILIKFHINENLNTIIVYYIPQRILKTKCITDLIKLQVY